MRKKMFIPGSIIGIVLLIYLFFFYNDIELTKQIPSVFKDSNIKYEFINGMTYIKESGQTKYPITYDETTLYILNGAGQDFTSYFIDNHNKEVVINMNLLSAKIRKSPYFQVVKVPKAEFEPIILKGTLRVRIVYFKDQSTLLEYDLNTKQAKTISHTLVGK